MINKHIAATVIAFAAYPAQAEIVLTTLEWPPYTAESLPKGGATTEVVNQAFANAGVDFEVEFLPWKRAIARAGSDNNAVAYFPGYHCNHEEGFIASDPIGTGPLGFAQKKEVPVTWETLTDIGAQKLRVGTVVGYANTDEFDAKAESGEINAIQAADDVTNLKKLARGRIDVAVIDKLVLAYLQATDPTLNKTGNTLEFNENPLEEKTLFLCFHDDETGREIRDRFNAGLVQLDIDQIVESYFGNEF